MNPYYGDFDTYHMAAAAIDEAVRNAVAVGADPDRIAILDNFCWGYTDRPETLGSLVRAALACYDMAVALQTPFISGKDSLNNEFSYLDAQEQRQTIGIPPSLLISALGQVDDVARCITMDLKSPGNCIYQVGLTQNELGGSHFSLVHHLEGGQVPTVDAPRARRTFAAIHQAVRQGVIRACHDMSEGGLAVSIAEMALAGCCGAKLELDAVPSQIDDPAAMRLALLWAESTSRFLCEVPPDKCAAFEDLMQGVPCGCIGQVCETDRLVIRHQGTTVVSASVEDLREAWQSPLRWS
jgi:phosphoribosylformylglycinamidine synthase